MHYEIQNMQLYIAYITVHYRTFFNQKYSKINYCEQILWNTLAI